MKQLHNLATILVIAQEALEEILSGEEMPHSLPFFGKSLQIFSDEAAEDGIDLEALGLPFDLDKLRMLTTFIHHLNKDRKNTLDAAKASGFLSNLDDVLGHVISVLEGGEDVRPQAQVS